MDEVQQLVGNLAIRHVALSFSSICAKFVNGWCIMTYHASCDGLSGSQPRSTDSLNDRCSADKLWPVNVDMMFGWS